MKYLLIVLLSLTLLLTGCALFGPSVQKAQEIAEKRQAEMNAAVIALTVAEEELTDLLAKYDAAVKADDKTTAEKLVVVINAALAKREAAEEVVDSATNVFDSAVQDFKDAKSTSDYIGTVLGWIGAGLGALGIGGGAAGGLMAKRRGEALAGTTNLIDKLRPTSNTDPAWVAATGAMNSTLSIGAKKAIEKFRP